MAYRGRGCFVSILLSFVNSVAQDNRFVKFPLYFPIPSAGMGTSPNARDKCFNFRFRREKLRNVQKDLILWLVVTPFLREK